MVREFDLANDICTSGEGAIRVNSYLMSNLEVYVDVKNRVWSESARHIADLADIDEINTEDVRTLAYGSVKYLRK